MTTTITTAKTCTRCLGTGRHSFNLKDGDVCYGCGGTGQVACAPKGQKKIKADTDNYRKAVKGNILEHDTVLYRVEEIRWIAYSLKGDREINQQLKITRLVDGKTLFLKRAAIDKVTGYAIHPTEEMIGQEI